MGQRVGVATAASFWRWISRNSGGFGQGARHRCLSSCDGVGLMDFCRTSTEFVPIIQANTFPGNHGELILQNVFTD